mmetsp:Transcript_25113/g.41177  ORF Transcript_25113/g.41177 Transcript_25113/m.41177 type:complete len:733 (+) Transcript_25113:141-2339(+)
MAEEEHDVSVSEQGEEAEVKKDKKSKKEKKEKKEKKKKKEKNDDDEGGGGGGEESAPKSPSSKKKKKKKGDAEGAEESAPPLTSPTSKKKKKKKGDGEGAEDLASPMMSPSGKKKFSVEYFEAILEELREKLEKKIKIKSKDREAFADACNGYYDVWYGKWENEQWLHDLVDKGASEEEIAEAQAYVDESNESLPQHKRYAIGKALKIFENLEEERITAMEEKLVKGAIIAQASPQKLADFAAESKENEKLLKRLFGNAKLMKDMLRHGGAVKYEYGNAMKIYAECIGDEEDDEDDKPKLPDDEDDEEYDEAKELERGFKRVNKKIALACALELASPPFEFDSSVPIDPVARYKHFEKAHRKGELDPAFPFFSVWEMRQIVNCDAPNDQMSWCRSMLMNYAPHYTCLTDNKMRYVYMMQTDVRIRKPNWTGSPRTYQMVLSGGGNESVNSWWGRFMLKSFGLPAWGAKHHGRKEGFVHWTPDGWVTKNGAEWDNCNWMDKSGMDFKTELEARNKAPQEEYFKKLVSLQCLADVVDGDPSSVPDYEKDALHGDRLWRSLSIVSMELLFQTEPEVKRTFERKGQGLVTTKGEKYLKKFEDDAPDAEVSFKDGILIIPASRHEFSDGNILVIESNSAGKQFNFVADGVVDYEMPEDIPSKTYSLALEVCTVSSKQTPLSVKVGEDGEQKQIKIPYTVGEWQFTKAIKVDLEPGKTLKFMRPKGSLGLAIKKLVLR